MLLLDLLAVPSRAHLAGQHDWELVEQVRARVGSVLALPVTS